MLAEVPPQHRATIVAIGRDLTSLARKDLKKQAEIDPMQARRDLTSLGLTYHDSKQFLEAVKRNDAIAAELFIAGRGVDLSRATSGVATRSRSHAPTATSASPS